MKQAEPVDPYKVAEAVADRTPIDWKRRPLEDSLRGVLANLEVLDRIAAVSEVPADEGNGGEQVVPSDAVARTVAFTSWGPLRIVEKIGEGGFAEVFLAHDPGLEKDVALKLRHPGLDAAADEFFVREARKLARVRHRNVLTVHGVASHDGRVGIWADFIQGRTLESLLSEQGRFGAEEVIHVGIELCRALAAVHAQGIIHGDVKTSNVMRESGGRIVLMDFSSAVDRAPDEGPGGEMVSGTPLFMAPEIFEGRRAGVVADIYSLGVVLYRLASGEYPVEGDTLGEIKRKHRRGRSTTLRDVCPDLSTGLVQVVERTLEPDPGGRFSSVGELERALVEARGERRELPETVRRVPRPLLPAAVGTLAAVLIAGWFLWPRPLEVDASLYRVSRDVDERLHPGSRIAVGDQLFLEIEGTGTMHVYVLNEDDRGKTTVLFPLPDLDLQNPLPGKTGHRLPGNRRGTPNYWDVTSAGGSEVLLVIASTEPLETVETMLETLPRAGREGLEPLAEEITRLRGITGLSPRPPPAGGGSGPSLARITEGLAVQSGNRDGLWLWEMHLSNPGGER